MTSAEPILVLGVGNYLMGDEGVGVHAIRELQKQSLPEHVHLLDGGTGGFHLLSYLENYSSIVMIDATMDGEPPGTVKVVKPRFASDFPRVLSAHDIGLRDLVESAALLGSLPETILITISIDSLHDLSTELSPPVQKALPLVSSMVKKVLQEKFLVQTNLPDSLITSAVEMDLDSPNSPGEASEFQPRSSDRATTTGSLWD